MKIKDLINGLETIDIIGDLDLNVSEIVYDSRKITENSVFVCISGFKVDGHEFVDLAIEKGAIALIVEKDVKVPENITLIKVENSRYALSYISDIYFNHPSTKFNLIGITGTKGKTTTTYMVKSILEKFNQNVGLIGTISNIIGNKVLKAERTTPESYELQSLFCEMSKNNIDSVVMETSSHALELHRVSCSDFDIGVFTNLSQEHLDFHETFENYFNAKRKLFEICKKALVNIDNKYGEELAQAGKYEVITYGIEKEGDIKASEIVLNRDNVIFKLKTPTEEDVIKVNIPGKFTIYNSLAAIGVAYLMGVPIKYIKEGLEQVSVPGRAETVEIGKEFSIMIDYAHSPDSLENILLTIKGYAKGRTICVFGCGGDRDKTKRPVMGRISGELADYTILTSDNPRTEEPLSIIKDIEVGIKNTESEYTIIEDRKKAIEHAIKSAKKDDVIVVAGKGHETYQVLKDKTINFDEKEIIREIVQNMDNDNA